ncbi:MAG TPA: Hsp70 family protein, partial [Jatrophihabitans sp.]|nr:Hsp70 family protein [Jatrophihabitans sp.]
MGYQLGVDLGTTFTAAAVRRGDAVSMLGLGNRAMQIPSVLYLAPDGSILVGEAAEARAVAEPDRVAREFKRRIGDPVPVIVGGTPLSAELLTGRLLAWVVAVATEREGAAPDAVTVSHPANWTSYKLDLLQQACAIANVPAAGRCSEPEAAAITYATRQRVPEGACVAVYDLGGGTFDAAVLRHEGQRFTLLGRPEGLEHLGGVDFDEAVFQHALRSLGAEFAAVDPDDPGVVRGLERLRRDCVLAKETLSSDTEAQLSVTAGPIDTVVRLTRAEFEDMIRPALDETVAATRRVLDSANLRPDELAAILLIGGSSRIPLVSEVLSAAFGRPLALDAHPKHEVATGAAWLTGPLPQPAAAPTAATPHDRTAETPTVPTAAGELAAAPTDRVTRPQEPTPDGRRPP